MENFSGDLDSNTRESHRLRYFLVQAYCPLQLFRQILEKIVHSRVQWHLEPTNAHSQTMSGLLQGRSSIDVIDLVTSAQESKAERCITVALFLDVMGAYDNVEQSTILRQMV